MHDVRVVDGRVAGQAGAQWDGRRRREWIKGGRVIEAVSRSGGVDGRRAGVGTEKKIHGPFCSALGEEG